MNTIPVDEIDHSIGNNNNNNSDIQNISTIATIENNSSVKTSDHKSGGDTNNHYHDNNKNNDLKMNNINLDKNQNKNWVQFDEDDDTTVTNGTTTTTAISRSSSPSQVAMTTLTTATIPPKPTKLAVTESVTTISTQNPSIQANKASTSISSSDITPAVLTTESVHVNLNNTGTSPQKPNSPVGGSSTSNHATPKNVTIPMSTPAPMRTIELSTGRIREGFANGDVIVTLLPINTKWPWITPAVFRPELVPEELMAQGLTLTVEEYVNAMETLVNDYRFTVYNICYKRVLVCWILFAFCVLLALLFSGLQGIALFSLGVGWLFLNAAAIFFCMWIKLRLSRGLEKCLARVNKQLVRHKILLVLDDRGRISCHKVNLCFLYFDPAQCIAYINDFIEKCEQNGTNIQSGWEAKLDLDVNDIVIQGSNPMRLSRKQVIAQEIYLSYLQRWGKDFLRRRLDWTVNEAGFHETPRHLMSSICPCQYTEELLNHKIKNSSEKNCCGLTNPFKAIC